LCHIQLPPKRSTFAPFCRSTSGNHFTF
jgi:hypothetical protein